MALDVAIDAGVMTLRLNRPEKRNALDSATIEELHAAIAQAELDAMVRLTGMSCPTSARSIFCCMGRSTAAEHCH